MIWGCFGQGMPQNLLSPCCCPGHPPIYKHTHTHVTIGMRGGPKTIKNMAAREPAKSCEGARSESRRPKRYKNGGFETSRKVSKKASFRRSGRPVMSENGRKRRFRFASGSLAALRFARFFWFCRRSRSENRDNASFLRVSRLLAFLGRPFFCQTKSPKKCEKKFGSKKTVRN